MQTLVVLLLFVASCSHLFFVHASPGGSSFGGVYEMKKSNSSSSSEYAFVFEDDSVVEQFRNGLNDYMLINQILKRDFREGKGKPISGSFIEVTVKHVATLVVYNTPNCRAILVWLSGR